MSTTSQVIVGCESMDFEEFSDIRNADGECLRSASTLLASRSFLKPCHRVFCGALWRVCQLPFASAGSIGVLMAPGQSRVML